MSKTFANKATYPLHWPESFPRTKRPTSSRFDTSLFKALENVQAELERFGSDSNKKVTDIVISSNYSLSDTKPNDAGVCVYFTWDNEQTVIPVDRYGLVEDNLQAIYHCISAERTKLRHGGINLVKAAFRGYSALPNPNSRNWRDVLGNDIETLEQLKKAYRKAIKEAHPDRESGNEDRASEVNQAYEKAIAEFSAN